MNTFNLIGTIEGLLMEGRALEAKLYVQEYKSQLPTEIINLASEAIWEADLKQRSLVIASKTRSSETASAKQAFENLFRR